MAPARVVSRSAFRAVHPQAKRWQETRLQLLGAAGSRREVGRRLGLCANTLSRYETGRAPAWYRYALLGLAAELEAARSIDGRPGAA